MTKQELIDANLKALAKFNEYPRTQEELLAFNAGFSAGIDALTFNNPVPKKEHGASFDKDLF